MPRSDYSLEFDVSNPTTHHWFVAGTAAATALFNEGEAWRRAGDRGSTGGFDPYEKEQYDDGAGKDV